MGTREGNQTTVMWETCPNIRASEMRATGMSGKATY